MGKRGALLACQSFFVENPEISVFLCPGDRETIIFERLLFWAMLLELRSFSLQHTRPSTYARVDWDPT